MTSASTFLDRYWDYSLPVRPEVIAQRMGIRVIAAPELGEISGEYRYENGEPTIRYNPNEPGVRQRFTVAHELGHHVLRHGPAFRDTTAQFNLATTGPSERQANRFAAELLIPQSALDWLIVDKGVSRVPDLAKVFAVSEVAMRFRMQNLGIIQ